MIRSIVIDRISIDGVPDINRSRVEIAVRAALTNFAASTERPRMNLTAEERIAEQIAQSIREAIRES